MWEGIFARAGRQKDLRVFGPGYGMRMQCLQELLENGASTKDCTGFLSTIGETINNTSSQAGGEHEAVWKPQQDRWIEQTIQIVKHAKGRLDPREMQQFINGAAQTLEHKSDPAWQNGPHCQALRAAYEAPQSATEKIDTHGACEFFLNEVPALADRTKSGIVMGVQGILHTFNTGIVRTAGQPIELLRRGIVSRQVVDHQHAAGDLRRCRPFR